jgi:hypothetical protein
MRALRTLGDYRVVCYIDALDECPEDDVRDTISFFEGLGDVEKTAEFRICFSSRHYPEISIRTGLQLVLETEIEHTKDITLYIDTHLKFGNSPEFHDIRAEILRKSSGIFLWVSLVVPILNKEFDRGKIEALKGRLDEIPTGLHSLFLDMLTRDHNNIEYLITCIQAVLFAARPLSPEELRAAIETLCDTDFQPGQLESTQVARDNLRKFILGASKGLVEITVSDRAIVQFIHESVRDLLLKDWGMTKLLPATQNHEAEGHDVLKRIYYMHLSLFDSIDEDCDGSSDDSNPTSDHSSGGYWGFIVEEHTSSNGDGEDDTTRRESTSAMPLINYAQEYLFYHAECAQRLGCDQVAFLQTFDTQAFKRIRYGEGTTIPHLLHHLGEHGPAWLIRVHPERNTHLKLSGGTYTLPLISALYGGHIAAAHAFMTLPPLAEDDEEPARLARSLHDQDERLLWRNFRAHRHPLDILCELGDTELLRTVFTTPNLVVDSTLATQCFDYASSESVIETLAELGAFIPLLDPEDDLACSLLPNLEDLAHCTLPHLARYLMEHPVLLNKILFLDKNVCLLDYATRKGFLQIVKLCVKATNKTNQEKAFWSAVRTHMDESKQTAIVQCLLEAGV